MVETRIIILDDLVLYSKTQPLPVVTQLNFESRAESRHEYESIGRGSYLNFAKDILVCGPNISEHVPNNALNHLAPRIRRLAFWDCFPDDARVCIPHNYLAYTSTCYQQRRFGEVEFKKLLFPNLKDLWIVKIGEVHQAWRLGIDRAQTHDVRLRKTARKFRYWVDAGVIEMAPLDVDDPDMKAVLKHGRCVREDCRELNRGRNKTISKITFVDGQYDESHLVDGTWTRIRPWNDENITADEEGSVAESRLRWIMVERILTFSLRWEEDDESEDGTVRRRACPT